MREKCTLKGVITLTWSCPYCGRPFVTQAQRDLHMMTCTATRYHNFSLRNRRQFKLFIKAK